ncbi:hypothetical protein [Mesobacterium pallidum]|uniref:hypothetical protein n=1 Tax=Mesobacterium pallidum TaxID=2872037 RepID=UPI001EE22A1B|nr:hypothetical protein [Mesobacterium pallidum]
MTRIKHLFLPVVMGLLLVLSGPLSVIAMAPPPKGDGPILVIGRNPDALVEAAGGIVVTPVPALFATLATGDADFVAKALEIGAWRVMDGQWIARICGYPEGTQT